MRNYWVYILTNPATTVLYTGMTNDLERRIREHESGKGEEDHFTGKYYCYQLVWYEMCFNARNAISREKQIKRWRRDKKERLINLSNPKWEILNDKIKGFA